MTSAPLKVAGRTNIAPFMVMDVLAAANARAAAGADVVHLEVGEPGLGPPAAVLAAASRLLGEARLGYTEALGLPALRRALARHYRRCYDLDVPSDRIIVTVGASGGFVLGFLAGFDPGDRVVVPEPAFPAYRNILEALGIEVVRLETGAASNFKPTPDLLGQLEGPLHGLIIGSPANPTGTMLDPGELTGLAAFCRARHPPRRRRDLPWHHVRCAGGKRAGRGRRSDHRRRLLQVFLHDRLAPRLAGRTAGPGAPDRAAGAEPVHRRADAGAARGHRGPNLLPGAGPSDRSLSGEPGPGP